MDKNISICLPKGDMLTPLAELLEQVNFPISGYNSDNRTYRPEVDKEFVRAKIMAEKDVAIQVAVGNYDIGCCGMNWIHEHSVKYKGTKLHLFKHLGVGKKGIYTCSSINSNIRSVDQLREKKDFVILVSEYPNLAEDFALQNRLTKFKVFSAWGSVEAYPPEHADIVIMEASDQCVLEEMGLFVLTCEVESDLCLVVNRESIVKKNLTPILKYFSDMEN